jgi:hypothetical protein
MHGLLNSCTILKEIPTFMNSRRFNSVFINPAIGAYPVPVESNQLFPAPYLYEPYRSLLGMHHWLMLVTSYELYRDWLLGSDVTLVFPPPQPTTSRIARELERYTL